MIQLNKILFQTPHLTLKETPQGYQYYERQGKDSVAIFLLRKSSISQEKYDVLIRYQFLPVTSLSDHEEFKLYPCPVTGGINDHETPEMAAIREVEEETGFSVSVSSLGHYFVGTQTNEICYLYYSDVTGKQPKEPQQDGTYFEAISRNEWHPFDALIDCEYAACQIGYFKLREILINQSN